jgi:hypothetical protein
MNIQSEWSNIHASTNMMKFTHETDKLQSDGNIYRDQSDYTKSDNNTNTSAYQKIYPEKILFFLPLQVIMIMKRHEEDFHLNILRIKV